MSIATALGGAVVGHQVLAPGPGHSSRDRSLAVFLDPSDQDGFRVHSHAGDDWKLCRAYVKSKLGILRDERGRGGHRPEPPLAAIWSGPSNKAAAAARTSRALALWSETKDIHGTPALAYLARRGIELGRLPADLDRVLRWHPSCPWEIVRHGCMVALMTDAVTGEPKAIHRTAIGPSGEKIGKKMLGPAGGCVVRLWADETVTTGLVLGEGIETTLAAATQIDHRGTHLFPAWAAGSSAAMSRFPVLAGVESLTLLVDNDPNGAGPRAALVCSQRWTKACREVVRLVPRAAGLDFNDIARCAA